MKKLASLLVISSLLVAAGLMAPGCGKSDSKTGNLSLKIGKAE